MACQICSKQALKLNAVTPLALTQLQLFFTVALVGLCRGWRPIRFSLERRTVLSAAFAAVGAWMTNESTRSSSLLYTHLVKSSEPLATAVLLWLLFDHRLVARQLVALAAATIGCSMVAYTEYGNVHEMKLPSLMFAVVSSWSMSYRNVLLKLAPQPAPVDNTKSSSTVSSTAHIADELLTIFCLGGALLVPLTITEAVLLQDFGSVEPMGLSSALSFALYNVTSIFVMAHVGVLMHSVLNVTKRLFIMIASLLASPLIPSPVFWVGVLFAIAGNVGTSKSAGNPSDGSPHSTKMNVIAAILLVAPIALKLVSISEQPIS